MSYNMDDIDEDDPPKPPGKKLIKGTPTGVVYNERCNTCNHVARHTIDKMIVTPNISIREIARIYDLSHNSVANHAREHISYETQAIKNIIAHEAAQQQANIEDGVQGEMARNVFLRAYLQKATEALLNGDLNLSGKEAMATIDMLKKAEEEQFAFLRLGGQILADGVGRQHSRERRVGQDDLVLSRDVILAQSSKV